MWPHPHPPVTVLLCPLSVIDEKDLSGSESAENACNEKHSQSACPIEQQWILSSQTGVGETGQ